MQKFMIVLFNLKEGVSPQDYEKFVADEDAPVVRQLPSVIDMKVNRVVGTMGRRRPTVSVHGTHHHHRFRPTGGRCPGTGSPGSCRQVPDDGGWETGISLSGTVCLSASGRNYENTYRR